MEKSESIVELAKALVKFNKEVSTIKKSADNPFFKSKYAPLDEIIRITKKPLSNNGLCIIQTPYCKNQLETMLLHESGEYISNIFECNPIPDNKGVVTPQGVGSCITYMKRYSYQAILGLSIGEKDDDGNIASKTDESTLKSQRSNKKTKLDVTNFSGEHWRNLIDWINSNDTRDGKFDLRKFITGYYECDEVTLNAIEENFKF